VTVIGPVGVGIKELVNVVDDAIDVEIEVELGLVGMTVIDPVEVGIKEFVDVVEDVIDVEIKVELVLFGTTVIDPVEVGIKELVDVIEDAIDVETKVELVLVKTAGAVLSLYRLSLPAPPQYSLLFPAQNILPFGRISGCSIKCFPGKSIGCIGRKFLDPLTRKGVSPLVLTSTDTWNQTGLIHASGCQRVSTVAL
jgi:hypothetical protein